MGSLHRDAMKAETPERGPRARHADRAVGEAGG